jgi:molecular chaperone GrpE
MEALSSEPTNEIPPGHVARVFKKAYKLHDKVIRPAQVVVAKQLE